VSGGAGSQGSAGGAQGLELRVERLNLTLRFGFAFHAREVRFERDEGRGFERIFPETFSFHVDRHDPAELYLQLDDLVRKPQLISPGLNSRTAHELMLRLLAQAPHYLDGLMRRLDDEGRLDSEAGLRILQDAAMLAQLLLRFIGSLEGSERRSLRVAGYLLQRIIFRGMMALVRRRVSPDFLDAWVRGEASAFAPSDDTSESGFFHVLEEGEPEVVDRLVVRLAQRSYFQWLEGVCLDPDNQAFEKEDSPFDDREVEILRAIAAEPVDRIDHCGDLSPFLRRGSRDVFRVLGKLESWFLLQYDVGNAAAIIHHTATLRGGRSRPGRQLSWHSPRAYVLSLLGMTAPFVGAAFAYDRAPWVFDVLCSIEVAAINAVVIWFLVYRFCVRRELSFFRASVPRIGAGIIVGYLPVFLIDEVWGLAAQSALSLASVATLLGLATLLYIYVEVHGRLGDADLAFRRARGIFLLGVIEAFGAGMVMTSLVGRFMVARTWGDGTGSVELLREDLPASIGQLPLVMGIEPFYVFPSAVLMMTFLSFFIGIFLQLMWEDIAITEPL